jgi:hypothetical protein
MLALAFVTTAAASSNRVPATLAERDLVVPRASMLLDGGPRWPLPEGQFVYQSNEGDDPAWINAGATFGIAQDFQLGAVVPLQALPDGLDLHDPRVHLLYQFVEGTADVGVFVQASLPFEGDLHTIAGLPLQLHLGSAARLDTGPFLRAGLPDDSNYVDFTAPFALPINVTRQFFLGPEAAIWTEAEFDYVRVPIGFFLGYTMTTGGGTVGDLSVRIRDLNARDAGNVWQLIFAADLFFDF